LIQIAEGEFILFNRDRDPAAEVWTGTCSQQAACEQYKVDQAFSIQTADEKLPALLANRHIIYCPLGYDNEFEQKS
jgi:Xaa-Pro aminopeptidase